MTVPPCESARSRSVSRAVRPETPRGLASAGSRVFPIGASSVYQIVSECARAAGLGEVRPHDLRRTLAKLSRQGGAPIEQIQQLLGHASVATTERYLGGTLELKEGLAAADYVKY